MPTWLREPAVLLCLLVLLLLGGVLSVVLFPAYAIWMWAERWHEVSRCHEPRARQ